MPRAPPRACLDPGMPGVAGGDRLGQHCPRPRRLDPAIRGGCLGRIARLAATSPLKSPARSRSTCATARWALPVRIWVHSSGIAGRDPGDIANPGAGQPDCFLAEFREARRDEAGGDLGTWETAATAAS